MVAESGTNRPWVAVRSGAAISGRPLRSRLLARALPARSNRVPRVRRAHRRGIFRETAFSLFGRRSSRNRSGAPAYLPMAEKLSTPDKEPLLAETPGTGAAPPPPKENNFLKYGSLGFLILQNSSHVLLLRYSRVVPGVCSQYTVSVAVLFAELVKLVFCLTVILFKEGGPCAAAALLDQDIVQRKMDTLKVSVPALCYTLQNNLQFVAASHLGAELLQLLYQTKTLATAIFGVIILSKSLRCNQWCALSVLVVGVVLAQSSQKAGGGLTKGNAFVGVLAALGVSVCSGFASVYLEKILKGDKTSIWVRNVQLCLFSVPLQLFAVYQRDWAKVCILEGSTHAPTRTRTLCLCVPLSHTTRLSYPLAGPGQRLAPWLLPRDMGGCMHVRIRGSARRGRHPIRRQ